MKLRKLIRLQFAIVAGIVGLGVVGIVNASRNSSGTYSLPATSDYPAVSGHTIVSADHNTTLADLQTEMTDSLSRSGKGAMLAPLPLHAGASAAAPDLTWSGDADTGLYRIGANNIGLACAGAKVVDYSATGVGVTGTLSSSGDLAVNTSKFTVAASSGNTAVAGTLGVTGATTATGGITVGSSGTAISKIVYASYAIDFPSLTTDTCSSSTQTLNGVDSNTGVCSVSPASGLAWPMIFICFASGANQITVEACNPGSATRDLSSENFFVRFENH